ncbi:unnamed protein product [Acanthoscelides obtectus]|uniref:Uncharacterized protein n=1 Tax=Acanthoscelides obtectus TaxID=200917 RepID=A0A9P0MAH6_ACAOB|nr:unnamed protein product [Acanthoscelides obtectus]CAK1672232.1 hypothetical protein AOBTE_LOCUS28729 [Acanthoscelides obtectus]
MFTLCMSRTTHPQLTAVDLAAQLAQQQAINNMLLNVNKCTIMTFTRRVETTCFNFGIGSNVLCRVNIVKDLGELETNRSREDIFFDIDVSILHFI